MGVVTKDLIEGARFTVDEGGDSLTRVYLVEDVAGNGDAQLYNAITHPEIPRYGDPHPIVPDIVVTNISANAVDDQVVKIEVTYSLPSGRNSPPFNPDTDGREMGTMGLSATVVEEETKFDVEGFPLKVQFTPGSFDDKGNFTQGKMQEQVATMTVSRPHLVLSFSRRETYAPAFTAIALVGTVNAYDIGPLAAETVLLTRVDATSDDGGASYAVSYEFEYDSRGWNRKPVAFIDPETNMPPATIVVETPTGALATLGANFGGNENGVARYNFYFPKDWRGLRLPWFQR